MKHPRTTDRPRTIRSRVTRRKKARRPLSSVVRVAAESQNLRARARRFTIAGLPPSACVDLPVTRRYSPESFWEFAEKLLCHDENSIVHIFMTIGKCQAGCSKRPRFSPAQPRRLLHPPALSLPRQPLRPGTRRSAGKAAASEAARRYVPHFVWAVRPCTVSWRTEKPFQCFRPPRIFYSALSL